MKTNINMKYIVFFILLIFLVKISIADPFLSKKSNDLRTVNFESTF